MRNWARLQIGGLTLLRNNFFRSRQIFCRARAALPSRHEIGAEVFGAAFAGGWALAILFGIDDTGAHILQAVLFAIGVFIMAAFIRAAQRVEPFTRRF